MTTDKTQDEPPAQEPVAWRWRIHTDDSLAGKPNVRPWLLSHVKPAADMCEIVPLYAAPSPDVREPAQQAEPLTEPPTDEVLAALAQINRTLGTDHNDLEQAIDAICRRAAPEPNLYPASEAIASQAQTAQPVAWASMLPSGAVGGVTRHEPQAEGWRKHGGDVRPLYAAPPSELREALAETERVTEAFSEACGAAGVTPEQFGKVLAHVQRVLRSTDHG